MLRPDPDRPREGKREGCQDPGWGIDNLVIEQQKARGDITNQRLQESLFFKEKIILYLGTNCMVLMNVTFILSKLYP